MATDLAKFEARYGFDPQEFVNLCAVGMLLGVKISGAEAEVVAAKAELEALGNPDTINAGHDQGAIANLALAQNRLTAAEEIVHDWAPRREYAQQFAEGKIGWAAFRSYFGTYPQDLIDEGLVDPKAVLAAVKAAL